jgi:hypothetical protein
MSPGHPNLFFNQVKVVEQPFGRGSDTVFAFDRPGHQLMRFHQDAFIVLQSSQQSIGTGTWVDLMPIGEALGVLLQLGGTEEL